MTQDIQLWLAGLGLDIYINDFVAHQIEWEDLTELNDLMLRKSLGIANQEHRARILRAIRETGRSTANSSIHLSPAGDPALVAFCQRLADAPAAPWVEAVIETWPGPIAHEYARLRQILAQGQILGALWQLKDITEVLIRFPTLVMLRDLIESTQRPELTEETSAEMRETAREARHTLLGPPLSLGRWLVMAVDSLAMSIQQAPEQFLFPEVAGLFRSHCSTSNKSRPKITELAKELEALTVIRNRLFGHGALQLDFSAVRQALAEHIPRLNRLLATHADLWSGIGLRVGTPEGPLLTGAAAIRHRHDQAASEPHALRSEPLWLIAGQRQLRLAPYMALRRCSVCTQQDTFLYDWRREHEKGRDRYGFIDFLTGHAMAWPWHEDPELHAETKGLTTSDAPTVSGDRMVQDYLRTDIMQLLEERALEAHYLSPGYLREPVADFIDTHERGVFWLQAPAHVGKSLFVRGLDPRLRAELKEGPLIADKNGNETLAVVAFYIRREYQGFRIQFRDQLQLRLREVFRIEPQRQDLPQLELEAADPPSAFADWLGAFLTIGGGLDQKLLVCIDGLDELRSEPGGSILNFLPTSDALPTGVYLLLTSRPPAECPGWVCKSLGNRYAAPTVCRRLQVGLAHQPYRELLERYFDIRLRPRLESQASHRMQAILAGQSPAETTDAPDSLPPALRKTFTAEWRRLQATQHKTDRERPLPESALSRVLTEFASLRTEVLEKAEGRFLYVGYLTDLLADHTLSLDAVDRLPPAEQLFAHYLTELERIQSDKPNALLRRVLLHLAAAEEAYWEDAKTLPMVAQEEWRGLPLDVLSELVEGRSGEDISQDLVYTLYSLKALLGTWKGDQTEHACFRLGLKGTTEAIRRHWPEELKSLHARQVTQLLERLQPPSSPAVDPEPSIPILDTADEQRLRYLMPHVERSGHKDLIPALIQSIDSLWPLFMQRCETDYHEAKHRQAIGWTNTPITLGETLRQTRADQWRPAWQNQLANFYRSRGFTLDVCGDRQAALDDQGRAIALGEALRQTLADQWPPAWQNDLANYYRNRGRTLANRGDWKAALDDYGQAITLGEALRQSSGDQWLPAWQYELARVYANRGVAIAARGNKQAALDDYGQAIALGETLRQDLGEQFPPYWQNALAATYTNRGIGFASRGDSKAALENYDQAITLREAIRSIHSDHWLPVWQHSLAITYSNRGITLTDRGNNEAALEDYDQAIALSEALRQSLGNQCPPAWQYALVNFYQNRGNALDYQGNSSSALDDYGQAISIGETLRQTLGDQCPPAWQNSIARAYQNRGLTHDARGNRQAALDDYDRAITLREALHQTLGDQWVPVWQSDLSTVYHERGLTLAACGDGQAALDDYNQAIALGESLLQTLGNQSSPAWKNHLANFYQSRGLSFADRGDTRRALDDYDQAITLGEALRQTLADQCLPAWQNDLVRSYSSRGFTLAERGDRQAALDDFGQAIAIGEILRQTFGDQWRPAWQNDLARAYTNRGLTLAARGQSQAALDDFGQAITIGESMRQTLNDQYLPAWQKDLADAYLNRGLLLATNDNQCKAVQDWQAAASLHLELLEQDFSDSLLPYLELQRKVLGTSVSCQQWEIAAAALIAFMERISTLEQTIGKTVEDRTASEKEDTTQAWSAELDALLELVQGYNQNQRFRLLAHMTEDNAEWLPTALGWNKTQ